MHYFPDMVVECNSYLGGKKKKGIFKIKIKTYQFCVQNMKRPEALMHLSNQISLVAISFSCEDFRHQLEKNYFTPLYLGTQKVNYIYVDNVLLLFLAYKS